MKSLNKEKFYIQLLRKQLRGCEKLLQSNRVKMDSLVYSVAEKGKEFLFIRSIS